MDVLTLHAVQNRINNEIHGMRTDWRRNQLRTSARSASTIIATNPSNSTVGCQPST
jgi:hypothetical protein